MSSKKNNRPKKTGRRKKPPAIPAHPATRTLPVARLRRADEAVTVVQVVALAIAWFSGDQVRGIVAIGCIVIFMAGAALFSWAFLVAAGRSRLEQVSVAGAFFLGGESTSAADRRWAYGLAGAQSVVGLAAAAADPYTAMAFGILVPMFGLGAIAFLGAAHGMFPVREPIK